MAQHPPRSLLFMPAANGRALMKARDLDADALIFDLEDAVAAPDKDAARDAVADILAKQAADQIYGTRQLVVRINAADTPWHKADVDMLHAAPPAALTAVLLPKVEAASHLDALGDLGDAIQRWAMAETPRGVLQALDIADHPACQALVFGSNDLAAALGADVSTDRSEIMHCLQQVLLAARAAGIWAFDSVYNAFKDVDGFVMQAKQGRALGFDGKSLIHPSQIEPCHQAYAPSDGEIATAKALIDAYQTASYGVATHNGEMIEELHVRRAQQILDRAGQQS